MATAHKLPSGSWRVKVFDHYETRPDGSKKIIFQSFTSKDPSPMGKREAERMAAEWAYRKKARPEDMSVKECMERYIDSKRGVLSPATVGGYLTLLKKHFSGAFGEERLRSLTDEKVQVFISDLSAAGLSGKTVRNVYSLFASSAKMFRLSFDVTLPMKVTPKQHTPTDEEICTFLDYIKNIERHEESGFYDCVMLSAFGSLRGERYPRSCRLILPEPASWSQKTWYSARKTNIT